MSLLQPPRFYLGRDTSNEIKIQERRRSLAGRNATHGDLTDSEQTLQYWYLPSSSARNFQSVELNELNRLKDRNTDSQTSKQDKPVFAMDFDTVSRGT